MSRFSAFSRVALSVALVLASVSFVDAQDRGQGRRGGRNFGAFGRGPFGRNYDKLRLVRIEQVQKEINVTDEQKPKIDGVLAAYREEQGDRGGRGFGRGRGRDLSDEERAELEKQRAEREKQRLALVAKFEKKLDSVLEKKQITRLNQIALQLKGTRGLVEAPVAASLKLSEEQVGKIKAVFQTQDDTRSKMMEEARGDRGAFREIFQKMQEMQKKADNDALAVLTKEQKEKYTSLKGKEFELDRRAMFGGGRGGRGRGGEGRGGNREGQRQRRRPPVDGNDA